MRSARVTQPKDIPSPVLVRGQAGQAMVEFGFVCVLLIATFILAVDVGSLYLDHTGASNWANQAAQAGADVAAVQGDQAACAVAEQAVLTHAGQIALFPSQIQVGCQVQDTANPNTPTSYGAEGTRQVVVTIDFQVVLPLWWSQVPVHVQGVARIDRSVGP